MHVTIVTTSFPLNPDDISGTFIKSLADNLTELCNVTILVPCSNNRRLTEPRSSYKIKCFRYAPRKWQVLAHQPGGVPVALKINKFLYLLLPIFVLQLFFNCIVLAKKTDVFHANWSAVGIITGLAALLTNKPCITTFRGSDIERARTSKLSRYILYYCLLLNTRVVAVSNDIQNTIVSLFPNFKEKISIIPNGVNDILFNTRQQSADLGTRIISVGSLINRKKFDTLIRAFSKLEQEGTIDLVIVGEGPEKDDLEKLALELNASNKIKFFGKLSHNEIATQLHNSAVFVLTSRYEGRPNAVLESMAAGLPIVASNIGGVDELVENGVNGYLCPIDDIECFSHQLNKLISDKELRIQMGKNSRKFIIKHQLTWQATAQNYYQAYCRIC